MSHISSFIDAPARPDRGKRLQRQHASSSSSSSASSSASAPSSCRQAPSLSRSSLSETEICEDSSNFRNWDFLKDSYRDEKMKKAPLVGRSSGRESKFAYGFMRRQQENIKQDSQRIEDRTRKESFSARHAPLRCANIVNNLYRHGNIITNTDTNTNTSTNADSEINDSDSTNSGHQLKRKQEIKYGRHHFSSSSLASSNSEREIENIRRQNFSAARYHRIIGEEEQKRIEHRQREQAKRKITTSSVIGYGRAELLSVGVGDNFIGDHKIQDLFVPPPPPPHHHTDDDNPHTHAHAHAHAHEARDLGYSSTFPICMPILRYDNKRLPHHHNASQFTLSNENASAVNTSTSTHPHRDRFRLRHQSQASATPFAIYTDQQLNHKPYKDQLAERRKEETKNIANKYANNNNIKITTNEIRSNTDTTGS